jgi:hypothetical protein
MSNILTEFNVPATMRDGVVLRANVFRPSDEGTYPVVLARTPYGKDFATSSGYMDALRLARAGYIVVIQDTRGRFASEGTFEPMVNESLDGCDTVEWAATLPGSNGNVGMYGGSYVGFTQWSAAWQRPPHLKALMPSITWSNARDGVTWRGGALELGTLANWLLGVGMETVFKRVAHLPPHEQLMTVAALVYQIDHLRTEGYFSLPLKDFAPLKSLALTNAYFDQSFVQPYSRELLKPISPAEHYDQLHLPAYNIGGWYDIFLNGTLQNFDALRGHGAKLLVGPWTHSDPNNVIGQMDFGFVAGGFINLQFDLTSLTQRWFDFWLKGIDNGITQEPPVKIFVMGANVWRDEHEWPLARTTFSPLYLRGNRGLSFEHPSSDEPADSYIYDPSDPTPTWGGATLINALYVRGVADQRKLDGRSDMLSFTSEVLDGDVEVVGPVVVKLWAASDARDTDFVARLIDVHPDGFAQNLCDGIIRARYRKGDTPELMQPDNPYEFTIDLWATANVFKAGHRIRLDIASASFPRWDRNPNTGDDFGVSARLQTARQTILHDAAHPSRVMLPIIPR